MKTGIVNSKELGNCWLPARFLGARCSRVMQCNYPEKRTCRAVDAEVVYLQAKKQSAVERIDKEIDMLQSMKAR
jgi:hypothetical protein